MVTFALVAESGPLEHQACLLIESLRRFGGRHAAASVIAVSPRAGRRPSTETRRRLAALGADYIELDVRSAAPDYGTTYRMSAAATIEANVSGTLVFLDSDIVFAGEPQLTLGWGFSAAARPVDVKGMCTSGPDDPCDRYWRALCDTCNVDYDAIPTVRTTVDRVHVKASYNGGFVVVRAEDAIFQRTEDYFIRSAEAGLMPWAMGNEVRAAHGLVTGKGARFWGSSQACLSLAIWGAGLRAQILPPCHNFPANSDIHVASHGMVAPLTAVHYHHLFGPAGEPGIVQRLNLTPSCRDWLRQRLPLRGQPA